MKERNKLHFDVLGKYILKCTPTEIEDTYDSEVVLDKETFIEAYNKWIKEDGKDKVESKMESRKNVKLVIEFPEDIYELILEKGNSGTYDINIVELISRSTPLEKELRKGQWSEHWIGCKCNKCGYVVQPWDATNFCPNCGADMRDTTENITENCIACKYDEDDDKSERCKKCIAGDSQFELDDALVDSTIKNDSTDYRRAFKIACELLNGDILYGIDSNKIFSIMMNKDGIVTKDSYEEYILNHLQELDKGQYATESLDNKPTDNIVLTYDSYYELIADRAEKLEQESIFDKIQNIIDIYIKLNKKSADMCLKEIYGLIDHYKHNRK